MTALLIATRAANIGASVLLAGTIAFEYWVARPVNLPPGGEAARRLEEALRRLAALALAVVFVSALSWFWLEVAGMNGVPLRRALSAQLWSTVLTQSHFGHVWALRVGAIAVAAAGLSGARVEKLPRGASVTAVSVAGFVVLIALAWCGHAVATARPLLSVSADALHLLAAGLWLGGLLPLSIYLLRSRDEAALASAAPKVVRRFSAMSVASVGMLAATGLVNDWFLVGSWQSLLTTRYGRLLLIKLACFAVMIAIGAGNRSRFTPQIAAMRSSDEDAGRLRRALRRRILAEVCLGTVILLVVAALGVSPPARHG